MKEPKVLEKFADNGEHSHWELIDSDTGKVLWAEASKDDEFILIEGDFFRRGDIYDIYDIERDKKMFFNRDAGFIVKTTGKNGEPKKIYKYGECIPYESYPHEIREKKIKWETRMVSAIRLWKG